MNKNIVISIIVIALVIGVSLFFLNQSGSKQKTTTDLESIPTIQIEPTEELPQYNKSDYQILIQNGSGVAGAAGDLQQELQDLEYNIFDIANANNYDYQQTVIQAKPNVVQPYIEELKTDLENIYNSVIVEELSDDNENDVIIIIGGIQDDSQSENTQDQESTENTQIESETKPTATPTPTTEPTQEPQPTNEE